VSPALSRRGRMVLAPAWVFLALLGRVADARGSEPAVQRVGCVGMTVANLDRSIAFYVGLFGAQRDAVTESWGEPLDRLTGVFAGRVRETRLHLGEECLELTEWVAQRGRAVPSDSRSNDEWFQHVALVVADMDRAYEQVHAAGVEHVSPAPQTIPDWNRAAGGIRAFYFRDPDRHVLELIWYPPGKGDPRWQRPGRSLFLGIDHTAIAVRDTEQSLRFWRDALGFRVAGESLNHGAEQERLSGVFGAWVRITALRAGRGPGIELLEYLAPRDGRPFPADARPNDLVHWQATLVARDVAAALARVRAGGGSAVSPDPVTPTPDRSATMAALVRDPDGHAVELDQP